MRLATLTAATVLFTTGGISQPNPPHPFDQLKALAGEWEADLPGFGKLTNTVRLVSNGKAVEETIGVPSDNETSLYTRDGDRILMTHYCAMTPDGHQTRFETPALKPGAKKLDFELQGASNLHSEAAPHIRHVSLELKDRNSLHELWTKTENGKDTLFDLNFVRR